MEEWEHRIISTGKGGCPLAARRRPGKELFGESGADTLADEIETNAAASGQFSLFPDAAPIVRGRARRSRRPAVTPVDDTDNRRDNPRPRPRRHAVPGVGPHRGPAQPAEGGAGRGPDFLRLANALSALYPRGSEEKRLLDGMLLAAPR